MVPGAKKPALIALDSNVLLDWAADDEVVIDAMATLRRRLRGCDIIVTPTVIEELVLKADKGDTAQDRALARKALKNVVFVWKLRPLNFIPVGRGIVAEIGRKLRRVGLIPEAELNDALIVAEAALVGATLLLSSDSHIKDLDYAQLKLELESCDVSAPLIASPYKIVNQFF